ncbi:UDP-glycosyltransferase 43 [Senna tora]|uniref:Glycosyltransferase n=1 Tax=Senna tora TaxID=362788 RepID=A0A834SI26_9FABA|nr:UDP-glycosyltransferase 43 [Senna tora]
MTRFEVIFVATPAVGNLVPAVEFANLLTKHDPRFSSTFLIITMPQRPLVNTYIQSRPSTNNLRFLHLPLVDLPTPDQYQSSVAFISLFIQKHKSHIKDAILNLIPSDSESHPHSARLAGLFVDMFSTTIIDVAAELGIPSYLFFASPASFLGFALHLPQLATESLHSETEFAVPSFKNPLPRTVLPNLILKERDGYSWIVYHAKRYSETEGIVINTVQELEPHALESLSSPNHIPIPSVYPIGPVLDLDGPSRWDPNPAQYDRIMNWLDQQPVSSVVFLCFGSLGSLSEDQVREIAIGLERAEVRFLWALREPPKAQLQDPTDYKNPENVLPDGFLKRTAKMGLVCGWVPQVKILAHTAIGGFVSHCGWNSIMESLWYGVPIATWPIYAEQQMNAFEMVKELGLALEIRLDYRGGCDLVYADAVEVAIKRLMNGCDEIGRKVKEMGEKCQSALMENGSSYKSLVSLVEKLTSST